MNDFCCGDPADCDGCVESLALEEAAAEQAERVYVDGEGNAAPLDEVLTCWKVDGGPTS